MWKGVLMPSENSSPTEGPIKSCDGCKRYGCQDCDPAPVWLFFDKGKAWAVGGDLPGAVELPPEEAAAEDLASSDREEPESCKCEQPGGFTLAIESGGASVVHTACGKQPWFMFNDFTEFIEMAPVPVKVDVTGSCPPSSHYLEYGVCDCAPEIILAIPPTTTSEEV